MRTIQGFYDKVAASLTEPSEFSPIADKLEQDVFEFTFVNAYDKYHLQEQTGIQADDFLESNPEFIKELRANFESAMIGAVIVQTIKTKIEEAK